MSRTNSDGSHGVEGDEAHDLFDTRQLVAAQALAVLGYRHRSRRHTGAVSVAARESKVSRSTVYEWLQQRPFRDLVREQRNAAVLNLLGTLQRQAVAGSTPAALALLKVMDRRFDDRLRLEKVKHENALELLERRAQLGLPEDESSVTYQIIVGEYGEPGFTEIPEH
jgi:hypothetical protein